jgi:hypothetical protein
MTPCTLEVGLHLVEHESITKLNNLPVKQSVSDIDNTNLSGTELGPKILRRRSGQINRLRRGETVWLNTSPITGSGCRRGDYHIGACARKVIARGQDQRPNFSRVLERKSDCDQRPPGMPEDHGLETPISMSAAAMRCAWACGVQTMPRGRSLCPKPGRSNAITRYFFAA